MFQADEAENKQFCYRKLTKIEWQRVEASGATSDNEWQQVAQPVTKGDNEL